MAKWLVPFLRLLVAFATISSGMIINIRASAYREYYVDQGEVVHDIVGYAPTWVSYEGLMQWMLMVFSGYVLYRRGHGGKLAAFLVLQCLIAANAGHVRTDVIGITGYGLFLAIMAVLAFKLALTQERNPVRLRFE